MNDDNKALKKKDWLIWVRDEHNPLKETVNCIDKKIAKIKGTLMLLIPLVIATFLAIMSLAIITANGR